MWNAIAILQQATRSQNIWRQLEELQVGRAAFWLNGHDLTLNIEHGHDLTSWGWGWNSTSFLVRTNIFRWFPVSPTYSHLGTVSSSHVYIAKHIQVWNQDSLSYGMESGWCRLHCKPFSWAQLLELWYRVLEALLYLLLTRVIWSSHAGLSGSGPHKF